LVYQVAQWRTKKWKKFVNWATKKEERRKKVADLPFAKEALD